MIKEKYVYLVDDFTDYSNLISLHYFIPILALHNKHGDNCRCNVLNDLNYFLAECLVEFMSRVLGNGLSDFQSLSKLTAKDIYFSAMPICGESKPVRSILFKLHNVDYLITELKQEGNDFSLMNLENRSILNNVINCERLSYSIIRNVIKEIEGSLDDEEEENEEESIKEDEVKKNKEVNNLFDLSEYEEVS